MGWDDPLELRGIEAAHGIGGCRESWRDPSIP